MTIRRSLILSAVFASAVVSALAGPALARPHGQGGGAAMLERLDADKDGTISKAEFLKPWDDEFAKADTDKNGSLSKAEFTTAANDRPHMKKMLSRANDADKALFTAMIDSRFRALDADGNGSISKTEFLAMHTLRFATLDDNKDGKLDKDELPDGRQGMMGGMPGAGPEGMGGEGHGMMGGMPGAMPDKDDNKR